jgi:hypothetical protein
MKEAAPEIGEKIGLQHEGSTPVTLPDGTQTHRNTWKVQDAGELAYSQLERRLSRSGVKETTLDYTRDFAERRGIAEQMGVRSEIEIPAERAPGYVRSGSRRPRIMRLIAEILAKSRRGSRAGSSCRSARGSRRRSTAAPQSVRGPETRARRGGRGAASRTAPARTARRSTRNGRSRPRSSGAACSPASSSMRVLPPPRSASRMQSGRKGKGACGRRRRPTGWPSGRGGSRRLSGR